MQGASRSWKRQDSALEPTVGTSPQLQPRNTGLGLLTPTTIRKGIWVVFQTREFVAFCYSRSRQLTHTLKSTNPSIHLLFHPSIHPPTNPFSHSTTHLSTHQYIHPSTYPLIHPSTHLSTPPPTNPFSYSTTHSSVHQSIHTSIHPSIH